MPDRSVSVALSTLVLAGAVISSGVASRTPHPTTQAVPSACSQSALSTDVQGLRAAAASLVDDLSKAGGSSGPISAIGITLANGQHLRLGFANGKVKLSGTGVPASCKSVVAQDDWSSQ